MPAASIPVTIDSFARAETDLYFGNIVRDGGIGKFFHNREPTPLDKQVDHPHEPRHALFAAPCSIWMPGRSRSRCPMPASRFMSMQVMG